MPCVPTVPPTSLPTSVSTAAASQAAVRERSPSLASSTASTQQSENSQVEEEAVNTNSPWVPDEPPLSLAAHLTRITAQAMTLGDEAMAAYQGMLSRSERLQAYFSHLRGVDIMPVSDEAEVHSSLGDENRWEVPVSHSEYILYVCTTDFGTHRIPALPTPFLISPSQSSLNISALPAISGVPFR